MGLSAMGKPGPNALTRFDDHACDLGVVGQEVFDQVQAKMFQGLDGVLTSHRIGGVFHSVSREDLAIVALNVRGLKVAFKAYRQSDLADVVAALLFGDAQQMNSRTSIVVFSESDRHWLAPEANANWRGDSSAAGNPQGGSEQENAARGVRA